ncbi:MAG: NAD(P)H-dependent oxidoreductase subunit E [Myxococcales bacterium]|nr:NAD(P)H-dependent oxidoreductase subunit E [Myxococcales bacterium]
MDLRALETPPSDAERAVIDALLGDEGGPATVPIASARRKRHLLLPALHAVQARVGWISPGALGYVCRRLDVPPAEGFGVASFYALFALAERPPVALHVCDDIACKMAGADDLIHSLTREFGQAGHTTGESAWHRSPCLGLCEQAPAALYTSAGERPVERGLGAMTHERAARLMQGNAPGEPSSPALHQVGEPGLRLLSRVGRVDPTSIDAYRAEGGYRALRLALELGPPRVMRELMESGLVGRGGAAFPTGKKWEAAARAPARPHYVVCNADESEPGTFKDRVLMEQDPFALIEAMTIAGVTVGAELGYLYVRAEYPLASQRLAHAIREVRARGLLGPDILGRGVGFELEIRRGAGAYICGEETALFNSLEGFRGEPRSKPPFPVEVGLFGKPTVVNNVETLVNVPFIVEHGAAEYRKLGTAASPGTRLFCVSGRVERPGLYELPFGVTLGALLERAGGVKGGRPLQGVLLGGAAGTFVGKAALALPLTFEDTRRAGVTLGSGVVLVLDDQVAVAPLLARIARFFRDESCGQCVPCRVGTVRQEELVTRLTRKQPRGNLDQELVLLAELGQVMRDASICGLGQTASAAIESAVKELGAFGKGAP